MVGPVHTHSGAVIETRSFNPERDYYWPIPYTEIDHAGDQSNADDVARLAAIGQHHDVDILLAHCWMRPMEQIVAGIDPALVILGHENEMGHTIDHREAYWLTFRRIAALTHPAIVMAWGEYLEVKE